MIRVYSQSKKGFTMVELMVSVVLIALIATVTYPAFVFSLRANNQNKIRLTANSIATDIIERIKGTPYEKIGNVGGSPEGIFPRNTTQTIDGIEYNIETRITWENRNNPEAYKNIMVTVRAQDAFSETQRIFCEMSTSVSGDIKPPKLCSIRVITKYATPDSYAGDYVYAKGPLGKNQKIYNGLVSRKDAYTTEAIFEDLPEGDYYVSVSLPGGYTSPEFNPLWYMSEYTKEVKLHNGNQETVYFYMDSQDVLEKLRVTFVDAETGATLEPSYGWMDLYWDIDGEYKHICDYVRFYQPHPYYYTVFDDYFSALWPSGRYNIVLYVDSLDQYKIFELDKCTEENAPYVDPGQHDEVTGTERRWFGSFEELSDIERKYGYVYIVIPLERETY